MLNSVKILRHLLAPLVLLALAALIIARNARAADAAPSWDALLDQGNGSKVVFGVKLGTAPSFERNAQTAFVPASVTKLFTTGAALENLGADYRFKTLIRWAPLSPSTPDRIANLTLIGSGDPSWGMASLHEGPRTRLERIAMMLAHEGVREIQGPIQLSASDARWSQDQLPEGWTQDDLMTCDGALPHAFNISLNCATLIIGDTTHSRWQEEGLDASVKLALSMDARTSVHAERDGSGYRISGTIAKTSLPLKLSLPVFDAETWARTLLTQALADLGVRVVDSAPLESLPTGDERTLTLESPPLREILKPFMKESINLIGQDLFIALGGIPVVSSFVTAHLPGPEAAMITLHDGSGLSHANRVTPQGVYDLLVALAQRSDFSVLWDALSIAGVDGTLGGRMRGTAAEGVVRGKTGTLRGAYNLAGYAPVYDALGMPTRFVPFVVLGQADPEWIAAAHAAQDRVAARMVSAVNE